MKWISDRVRKQREKNQRERELTDRVRESQIALLDAATSTADTAQEVTIKLKNRLDDSLRQFELAASMVRDALIVCDEFGIIQSFNPAAVSMFGVAAGEALLVGIHGLFHAHGTNIESPGRLFEMMMRGEPIDGLRADGQTFSAEIGIAQLDRHNGSTISIILVRHLDCEPLHTQAVQYRSIFEAGCDGILVVKNEVIAAVNPAAAALFGYSQDELLSMPIGLIVSPTGHTQNKSAQAEVMAIQQDGSEIAMMIQTAPITWDDGGARLVAVKTISKNAVRAPDGDMFCFGSDWRMASARRTSTDMIFCMDENFVLTFANRAFTRHFGLTSTIIGRNIHDLLDDAHSEPLALHLLGLDPETPTRRMQLETGKGGERGYQVWHYHADYGDDGALQGYQCVGRDITSRLRTILGG